MRITKSVVDTFRTVRPVVGLFFLLGYVALIWLVVVSTQYSLEYAFVSGDESVIYRTILIGAGLLAIPPVVVYYVLRNR